MPRISYQDIPDKILNCMMQTEKYIKGRSIIDEFFMELLRYRISVINQCAYCIEMHFKEAVAAGESELRIYSSSAWREVNYYNAPEQALLEWAESVTMPNDTPEARQQSFDNLSNHFSHEDIANITLAIAQINSWNRLVKSFGFVAGSYQLGHPR